MLRSKVLSSPITIATKSQEVTGCLPDLAATRDLGHNISRILQAGDALRLDGDLGVGKTELARCIIRSCVGAEVDVPSPSYTLVQTYQAPRFEIIHADLYRLGDANELDELGLAEESGDSVLLVEWWERATDRLPAPSLTIALDLHMNDDARAVTLSAHNERWQSHLAALLR